MTFRTLLLATLVVFFVLDAQGNDTLKVRQNDDLRLLRQATAPKCLVIEAESDELSLRRLRKVIDAWGGVPHIIFEDNGFETMPAEAMKMRCERLTFQGQLLDDPDAAVDAALAATHAKTVSIELTEFNGLAIRERRTTRIDSIVLFTQDWSEFHQKQPEKCLLSYLSVMVPDPVKNIRPLPIHFLSIAQEETSSADVEPKNEACKKYVSVAPPIETMKVPFEQFQMTGNSSGMFTAESGTLIRVQENAFLNEKGQPFKGPVQIDYREFRDPLDFMRSGIRMSALESDSSWYFKSSGMFEINARSGDQELFLAEGKSIDIDFISANNASGVGLFRYEDAADTWLEEGNADLVTATTQPRVELTEAYRLFETKKWRGRNSMRDTTQLQNRFANFSYIYNYHIRDTRSNINGASSRASLRNQVRLTRVGHSKEFGTYFRLATKFSNTHPELRVYRNVAFAVGDRYTPQQLRKAFKYRDRPINDVRLSGTDENVTLRLKGKEEMFDLEAQLIKRVEENNKKKWVATKAPIMRYNRTLKQRTKVFNRKEKKSKIWYLTSTDNSDQILRAWQECRSAMTPKEREMTPEQWYVYCDSLNAWEAANFSGVSYNQMQLNRRLSVSALGIWNCDIRQRLENEQTVIASYTSEDNKPLFPKEVFVLNDKQNVTLRHTLESTSGYSTKRLIVPDINNSLVVAMMDNNQVGLYTTERLAEDGKISRNHTFVLKVYDADKLTPHELEALMGMR